MAVLGGGFSRALHLTSTAVVGAGRVLEVAAGTGMITAVLAKSTADLVATDHAEAVVEELAKRVRREGLQNVRVERADILELPYEARSFDVVVATNVLHLLPELSPALSECRRVLKPGGLLVAPTLLHEDSLLPEAVSRALGLTGCPSVRRFGIESLSAALEGVGFSIRRAAVMPGLIPIAYVEAAAAT